MARFSTPDRSNAFLDTLKGEICTSNVSGEPDPFVDRNLVIVPTGTHGSNTSNALYALPVELTEDTVLGEPRDMNGATKERFLIANFQYLCPLIRPTETTDAPQ